MDASALPYTLLLILAELAVGGIWVTLATDLRGGVTRGFVMTMALCVAIAAGLAWWTASSVHLGGDVDGYRVDRDWFTGARRSLMGVTLAAAVYAFAVFMGWDPVGRLAGIVASGAGFVTVVFLAGLFAPPAWGFPAVLLALLAGALSMGAVSVAMVWGHWYLTEGSLPAWPLRDLAVWLIGALAFQAAVLAVNLAVPVRETPDSSNSIDVGIFGNPVLYLRIGVGLVFPVVLAVLSLRTARIRAMQSATGLLYICMGAVFVGEALGKGLMLLTARPL